MAETKEAPETFAQYITRILSYIEESGRPPLAIMRRTPTALPRRLAGVPRRRLSQPPRPGKWSVRDIVAHLSETDLIWGTRIRLILGQNGVPIIGMDQDEWAKRYKTVDPRKALATFVALRRSNLELLDALRPADFRRWGQHSQFGRLTIGRIVLMIAGHDINHSRQIEAILSRGRSRRVR